jgi:ribulose bisphosphate carboxylase small subunit
MPQGFSRKHYIKLNGYDRTKGRQTTMLSFIVQRPEDEPGFSLERAPSAGSPHPVHHSPVAS